MPTNSAPAISVVVPVYNAEATLTDLVARLTAALDGHVNEFIFVDDGSADRSWALLTDLAASHPSVRAIRLMRNAGQHNALLCGIRAARHPITVTIDDDLQYLPEEIPLLIAALDEETDVVYGTREDDSYSIGRSLATKTTKLVLARAMPAEVASKISSFRAFKTELREGFADYNAPYVSIDVLLTWSTSRFAGVTTSHEERIEGRSGYTLGMLARHAMNLVTGFSVLPLQIASFLGLAVAMFGFALLVFVIGNLAIRGSTVPGFTFLAASTALFAGAQLLALGVIGEYIARMHFRTMNRPPFVVRTTLGGAPDPNDGPTISGEYA